MVGRCCLQTLAGTSPGRSMCSSMRVVLDHACGHSESGRGYRGISEASGDEVRLLYCGPDPLVCRELGKFAKQ